VIVVVGSPIGRLADGVLRAGGMASGIALAAAAAGRSVQVVGKTGDDATADAVVLDLGRGGVGHVALLRDPSRPTPLEAPRAGSPDPDRPDDEPGPSAGDVAAEGPVLEAADVDLGLRYLTDFAVVVLTGPFVPDLVATVSDAASWAEARAIMVVGSGEPAPEHLPADVIVFEAPDDDPDGAFATLVGAFAAGLDTGAAPDDAFRSSIALDGWSQAPAD
jgi:hypothetical protein